MKQALESPWLLNPTSYSMLTLSAVFGDDAAFSLISLSLCKLNSMPLVVCDAKEELGRLALLHGCLSIDQLELEASFVDECHRLISLLASILTSADEYFADLASMFESYLVTPIKKPDCPSDAFRCMTAIEESSARIQLLYGDCEGEEPDYELMIKNFKRRHGVDPFTGQTVDYGMELVKVALLNGIAVEKVEARIALESEAIALCSMFYSCIDTEPLQVPFMLELLAMYESTKASPFISLYMVHHLTDPLYHQVKYTQSMQLASRQWSEFTAQTKQDIDAELKNIKTVKKGLFNRKLQLCLAKKPVVLKPMHIERELEQLKKCQAIKTMC